MFETSFVWTFSRGAERSKSLSERASLAAETAGLGELSLEEPRQFEGTREIAEFLQEQPVSRLFNSVAVVEWTAEPSGWPVTRRRLKDLVGLWRLFLLFPEVYWVFVVDDKAIETEVFPEYVLANCVEGGFAKTHLVERSGEPGELAKLLLLHRQGFRPIFDPFGMRRILCQQPVVGRGLSIEDEPSYCLLNGYFLFRNGFATALAGTAWEYERQLREVVGSAPAEWCVFEDVELNFPGVGVDVAEAQAIRAYKEECVPQFLRRRAKRWKLDQCRARVLVTGLELVQGQLDGEAWAENATVRRKPYSGFFDDALGGGLKIARERGREAVIEDVGEEAALSHSPLAPNQEVALGLLRRCRGLLACNSLLDGVCGSVMMTTAQELLGTGPVHLAGEAIIGKHRLEVSSEMTWVGMTASPTVATLRKRYRELDEEIRTLVASSSGAGKSWTPHTKRVRANLMLHACAALRNEFEDGDRRTEEEFFLGKYRKWFRREWKQRFHATDTNGRGLTFGSLPSVAYAKVMNVPFLYLNFLMSGWPALAVSGLVWILVFAGLYMKLAAGGSLPEVQRLGMHFSDWVAHSATVFSGLATSPDGGVGGHDILPETCIEHAAARLGVLKWFWRIAAVEVFLGVIHVGVFITLLVQKFLRR